MIWRDGESFLSFLNGDLIPSHDRDFDGAGIVSSCVRLGTAPLCLSFREALSKCLDGVTIESCSGLLNVRVGMSKWLELFPFSDFCVVPPFHH